MAWRFWLCLIVGLTTGPADATTLRVAIISDLNGSYGSTEYSPRVSAAIARIIKMRPDLVLSTGDMVAGQRFNPKLAQTNIAAMWDSFHATVTKPLTEAGLVLAVTPGNHDASAYPGFAIERTQYAEEWAVPPAVEMVDAGTYPFAYAFAVGGVLFLSIDATTIGELSGEQMAWLEAVLARDGQKYRARVAFSHLPLWPFAIRREREIIGDQTLASVFRKYDVDLHLSGHHHAYYPGRKDGTIFVSQACLGGGARRLIGTDLRSRHSFTMVEIAEDGTFEIYALEAPNYLRRIDHLTLPERIVSPEAILTRIDLATE